MAMTPSIDLSIKVHPGIGLVLDTSKPEIVEVVRLKVLHDELLARVTEEYNQSLTPPLIFRGPTPIPRQRSANELQLDHLAREIGRLEVSFAELGRMTQQTSLAAQAMGRIAAKLTASAMKEALEAVINRSAILVGRVPRQKKGVRRALRVHRSFTVRAIEKHRARNEYAWISYLAAKFDEFGFDTTLGPDSIREDVVDFGRNIHVSQTVRIYEDHEATP